MDIPRPRHKNSHKDNVINVVGVVVVCALIVFGASKCSMALDRHHDRVRHERYAVWCKLNARTDLTYDEWLIAYRADMLRAP